MYDWLTDPKQNGWNKKGPSWNFTKYLIDENGKLIISKGQNKPYDSQLAVDRSLRAVTENKVKNTGGTDTIVGADTICVHSDTPNAIEIITKLNKAIKN